MTPEEAHQILTQATAILQLNRSDTFKVLQALETLRPKAQPEVPLSPFSPEAAGDTTKA